MFNFFKNLFVKSGRWSKQIVFSSIILAILVFIVVNFYVFSSIVNLNSFFYAFLLLSVLTDGLFLFVHLPRKGVKDKKTYFNPATLSVVIASYNGEDVIAETIKNAAMHVPLKQIIVISDGSTDKTAAIAKKTGAQVIDSKINRHKVGSINYALQFVKTPYVLIMDDDTLIGKTFLPTSLLDEGYTAVAFNVMPVKQRTVINELQQFEYRATMQIGKNMRSKTGAIGNVSGAIGMYRTEDLKRQINMHSGQFAGEDEQRTLLAHMYGEGKGITYTDSLVLTKAPETYRELFRQRTFSWSISLPELFMLYWRVLLSPRYHFLLKAEKAYLVYIYVTEPLRILFLWALFLKPSHLLLSYAFYLGLNLVIWFRLGFKDSIRSVLITPIYTLFLTICRIIGYFYWLKVKFQYIFIKKTHRAIAGRKLLAEYGAVMLVIVGSWVVSIYHFQNDMNLFNKIRNETLTSNENTFNYDYTSGAASLIASTPTTNNTVAVFVEPGDSPRALAHKAIEKYSLENLLLPTSNQQRWVADMWLAGHLQNPTLYPVNTVMPVAESLVIDALKYAEKQGATQP